MNYKKDYPNAIITCFEPDPIVYRTLMENLEKNCDSDINAIEAAVWTANGEMSFLCEGADGGRLLDGEAEDDKTAIVKTIDLSQYIARPIDLLKIDIEGAEFDVIPHIQNKMHMIENIIIECHLNYSNVDKFSQILTVLKQENYEVSFNTYGPWRDLVHKPHKLPNEFDQYILVVATKKM
ncbi:FkbM family methyltransferase [Methanogenium sp. S4BF]|nr:FkbM family methyltransferase [Methanogenium sp. S4BF]